jgi:adenylate cyclase
MCYERLGQLDRARELTEKVLLIVPAYLRAHPDDARAHMTLAVDLAKVGKLDEARKQSYKALEIAPNDSTMLYFAACLYSRLGDTDLSVNTLSAAINAGWKDFEWIKKDTDFNYIRTDPGYIELMKGK